MEGGGQRPCGRVTFSALAPLPVVQPDLCGVSGAPEGKGARMGRGRAVRRAVTGRRANTDIDLELKVAPAGERACAGLCGHALRQAIPPPSHTPHTRAGRPATSPPTPLSHPRLCLPPQSARRFVEVLDRYFQNVCELDLIFNFHKAYYILDELLVAGERATWAGRGMGRRWGWGRAMGVGEGQQGGWESGAVSRQERMDTMQWRRGAVGADIDMVPMLVLGCYRTRSTASRWCGVAHAVFVACRPSLPPRTLPQASCRSPARRPSTNTLPTR